jgi:hypothetical protein
MKNEIKQMGKSIGQANKPRGCLKLSKKKVRVGWREGAQAIVRDSNDDLLLDEFPNIDDKDLVW